MLETLRKRACVTQPVKGAYMRSRFGRHCVRIEKGHNNVYVPDSCGPRTSRRLTLMFVALLLVLLEVELLSSNAIGFFRMTPASADSTLRQASMMPSVLPADPAIQTVNESPVLVEHSYGRLDQLGVDAQHVVVLRFRLLGVYN